MPISLLNVRQFTPNVRSAWTHVGNIAAVHQEDNGFFLQPAADALAHCPLHVSFLSPTCLRVRFAPPAVTGHNSPSAAVIAANLAPVQPRLVEDSKLALVIDTGVLRIVIDRQPYRLSIFRDGQRIHADEEGFNVVYAPGSRHVANLKQAPTNARYCGFGETAGATLLKNFCTMTQFNFDNFACQRAPLPADNEAGPLNPSGALYASIPLLIEVNPRPVGEYAGPNYAYGVFLDNPSQSFFNICANDYSDMSGRYYFGAVAGVLDYYIFVGDGAGEVLAQYTALTGRGAMPPRYVFGLHQGCYGYYDRGRLEAAAAGYRQAHIPCDGLHIDVDFQDNYRTFTHSERKFPHAREMLDALRADGFKCATNVSPLLSDNPLDETGHFAPYPQRAALLAIAGLLYDVRAGQQPAGDTANGVRLFDGRLNYGTNNRVNPYHYPPLSAYPPLAPNRNDAAPLGASGNYADLGRTDVRHAWGEQYAHLIDELGMDMIWQDMTCPAQDATAAGPILTLPLDLMLHDGEGYLPHGLMHNAYAQWLLRATWEGLTRLRADQRPFILARGGYAGMQRYAALWTGDNASSWDFLRINIPQVLNIGLSGVPISGADIGGFARGSGSSSEPIYPVEPGGRIEGGVTEPELFVRWMQLGAFLPWFRNHYNGYDKAFQEPWAYDATIADHCRRIVHLRYRLLQVIYDAMYHWTQTGMPIARALFLNDADDREVYDHLDDQFFLGRDLMIAPIVHPAAAGELARRQVYLPAGVDWYPFSIEDAALPPPLAGGRLLDVHADLGMLPLYVRAGAILPLRTLAEDWVDQRPNNPLRITCYPGADRDYLLYQDDGITTAAATAAAYRTTRISQSTLGATRCVRLERLHDGYTPPETCCFVALRGCPLPVMVSIDGETLPGEMLSEETRPDASESAAFSRSAAEAYVWNAATASVVVRIAACRARADIRVSAA